MIVEIRVLRADEAWVLEGVAEGVFDHPISPRWAAEFFADPRHHLAVALISGRVVGMASGIHYVHPDKPPELWVNEVGVADQHAGQGIGRRLLAVLFDHAQTLGCAAAWVLTHPEIGAACRMYEAAGGQADPDPVRMYSFAIGAAAPAVAERAPGPGSTSREQGAHRSGAV